MKLKFVAFRSSRGALSNGIIVFGIRFDHFLAKNYGLGVLINSCFTHNSSLEGAMKLKFVPFRSSRSALSNGILVF